VTRLSRSSSAGSGEQDGDRECREKYAENSLVVDGDSVSHGGLLASGYWFSNSYFPSLNLQVGGKPAMKKARPGGRCGAA
jgi:hypothetical protein